MMRQSTKEVLIILGTILTVISEIPGLPLQPADISDNGCTICKIVLQSMDKTISINDDTRKEIAKVVHSACNYLPAQIIATECNYFVNKYGDAIIDVLSEGINPKETCTRLGLCKESIL